MEVTPKETNKDQMVEIKVVSKDKVKAKTRDREWIIHPLIRADLITQINKELLLIQQIYHQWVVNSIRITTHLLGVTMVHRMENKNKEENII